MRIRLRHAAVGLLPGVLSLALPADASAADCTTTAGVSVVVDFGATVRTGCAPGDPSSAWAALQAAGFSVEGTQRFPASFVCRIDGFPAPAADACVQTPPATAYWAVWTAAPGGGWTYSSTGASSIDPAPGTAIGFAFGAGATPSRLPPAPSTPPPTSSTTRPTTTSPTTSRPTSSSRPPTRPPGAGTPSTSDDAGSLGGSPSGTTAAGTTAAGTASSGSATPSASGRPTATSTSGAAATADASGSGATASGGTSSEAAGLPEGSVGAVAAGTGLALVLGGAAYGISRRRRVER